MLGKTLSHYQILERIGAGGMGVVYRARDQQLEREVAIKVLPAGTFADESARKRFRKEALALARLNHPNIAAVHEFGTENDHDFLVLELISGVTLDIKLAAGALNEKEVLRLGAQLADGLSAAHQEGIVHRDLKPGNIRVNKDGRLKILDFGLAEWTLAEGDAALTVTLTKSQEMTGTLPYMAPEQLRGKPANFRTDIYSAGVVLYEMATGKRPHTEPSGPQLVTAILEKAPSPPSSGNRTLSPALEGIILKALDKDPNRRYQSARELRIDLERLSTGGVPVSLLAKKRRWPWVAGGVALVLLLVLGLNPGNIRGRVFRRPQQSNLKTVNARRAVAVLGFKNISGRPDEAWISTALGEMLTTELAAGGQVRAIPGENVARMKLDLSLSDASSYGADTLTRIRNHLGSDLVVLGSYVALGKDGGGKIRIDLQLQDTAAGETIAVLSENGTESELFDVVSRTGAQLRQKLGVGAVSQADAPGVRAAVPGNSESARLYAQGLSALRLFDAITARPLLEKAVAADPKFALAYAALSEAWSRLGYDVKAREAGKKALELSDPLSQEDRLAVEARYHEVIREWPKAIESYQRLLDLYPDNLNHGLHLAAAQIAAGQPKDALETVAQLRQLPAPVSEDARIDLAEARAAETLGDFKREQQVAGTAARKASAVGARLVLAEARACEGWAAERLGQPDQAMSALAQVSELRTQAGDRHGAAQAWQMMGDALYDRGDYAAARKNYQEALAVYRQVGAQKSIASAFNSLGNVAIDLGHLAEAKSYYEQTLAIAREVGAKNSVAGALGNIANVLDNMGFLEQARKKQEECLVAFREVGNKRGEGSTLNNLGNVLNELGDLEAAKQKYNEALAVTDQTGYRRGRGFALQGLIEISLAQDQIPAADKTAQELESLRRELKEENNLGIVQLQLTIIRLEQGRAVEAEAYARAAIETFGRIKQDESVAASQAVLGRTLLAQGKADSAQALTQQAFAALRKSIYRPPRFEATLANARAKAAMGKTNEALQDQRSVLAEATRFGYVSYQFEARLAIGETQIKRDPAGARRQLEALAKDARAKGYLLIARKATSK